MVGRGRSGRKREEWSEEGGVVGRGRRSEEGGVVGRGRSSWALIARRVSCC